MAFLDAKASLEPTLVSPFVRQFVGLSQFQFSTVSVSLDRNRAFVWEVIYFMKAMTNCFQIWSGGGATGPKLFDPKLSWLAHFLSEGVKKKNVYNF